VITQKELSEILGVHQTTISGVLSRRPGVRVSPETRRRILEAVEQYGYKPSLQARILRQGRSQLIGVLNFMPGNQGLEKMLRTVEMLQEKGFSPLVNEIFRPERAMESLQLFLDLKVSGVILKSLPRPIADQLKKVLLEMPVPAVCVEGAYIEGLPWVYPDKAGAMEELTLGLIGKGYRRLALMPSWKAGSVPVPNYSHAQELTRGFQAAVEKSVHRLESVEIIRKLVVSQENDPSERNFCNGRETTRQLIAERRNLPEVLICNDDPWALGAMTACFEAGIKVPAEIALTGFGNSQAGRFSPIALTTVNQPLGEMIRRAVSILCAAIEARTKPEPGMIKVPPCEVIYRQSTRVVTDEQESV